MIPRAVVDQIEKETGKRILPSTGRSVSGGCIHQSAIFRTEEGSPLFVKLNRAAALTLFETEARSLEWIASSNTVRVPHPSCHGKVDETAFLAMEALTLSNRSDSESARKAGHALARLHRVSGDRFGADFDNFIGATPQPNRWTDSWADFFTEQRLRHQFQLAAKRGRTFPDQDRLLRAVHSHLSSLDIEPSLLHGDLWGGNASYDERGEPVFFDPASYLGDREADIAFTRVFGGFGPGFYDAYRESHPDPEPVRVTIYNLYHILNHYVLFGSGYADQAEAMMTEILREL